MFISSFRALFVDELRRHHRRLRAGLDSLAAAKDLVLVLRLELGGAALGLILSVLALVLVSVSVIVLESKFLFVLELAGGV